MTEFHIQPAAQPLKGTLTVPADKSISHRSAIFSVLADGETRIENFLESETTHATLNVLRALGAEIGEPDPRTLLVKGRGLHSLKESNEILFCAGSGTTMRLLAGLCGGQEFLSILDGSPALKRRPMARIVEPLQQMGARVLARDNGRLPPLAIRGSRLCGIDYSLPVASAQAKSAIMLAALFASSSTTIREPSASRDHTERMLAAFGGKIKTHGLVSRIEPVDQLSSPTIVRIPNDLSSAAFFIVAAVLIPGSEILIANVGINPTRTGLFDALAAMGAAPRIENTHEVCEEPVADVVMSSCRALRGTQVAGEAIPRMIDEFPIFAVAATQAQGETIVRDAAELRAKESDRISALASELRKMGAQIEEHTDGFVIAGPTPLRGARVSSHNDHRLAMALAVAGSIAMGETVVEGWECVADSFPNVGELLSRLVTIHYNS